MNNALVAQANAELRNSDAYLSMSLYFDRLLPPLEGFSSYFRKERYSVHVAHLRHMFDIVAAWLLPSVLLFS